MEIPLVRDIVRLLSRGKIGVTGAEIGALNQASGDVAKRLGKPEKDVTVIEALAQLQERARASSEKEPPAK